jgi:hypothetical protein
MVYYRILINADVSSIAFESVKPISSGCGSGKPVKFHRRSPFSGKIAGNCIKIAIRGLYTLLKPNQIINRYISGISNEIPGKTVQSVLSRMINQVILIRF